MTVAEAGLPDDTQRGWRRALFHALSDGEKRRLLEKRIVLCRDVQSSHLLQDHGIRPDKIPGVLEEAKQLCGT